MSVKKNRSSNQNKKIEEKKKHTTHNTQHTYLCLAIGLKPSTMV